MCKRILIVCVAALLLAACSHSGDSGDAGTAPASAPTTAPATASPPAAATTSTAPASPASTPAAASSSTADVNPGDAAAAPAKPAAPAQPFVDDGTWVEGKNYFAIQPAQPKVTGTSKIEVVEAFSYGCPACFQAHTFIDKLQASLPDDAVMVYLPASFSPNENWPVYQRAYYTALALGIAAKAHDAMFDATWKTGETATFDLVAGKPKPRAQWPTIETLARFYSKYGVSEAEFLAVAKSFAIDTRMRRADELMKAYAVGGTPTIVIDGKYRFDGRSAGTYPNMIELAKFLVAKVRAGQ